MRPRFWLVFSFMIAHGLFVTDETGKHWFIYTSVTAIKKYLKSQSKYLI